MKGITQNSSSEKKLTHTAYAHMAAKARKVEIL